MTALDVDEALSALGKWNRWQLIMYTIISLLSAFPASWHMLAIVFLGLEPDHHCLLPEDAQKNESIPYEKTASGELELSKCEVYVNYSKEAGNYTTTKCPNGWVYDDDLYSIQNEWDLVCEKAPMVQTTQTVLVVGVMLGAMIMSMLNDRFGRKLIFLLSVVGISIVGVLTAFVTNYYVFAALRFFSGFFQQGVVLTAFVYACELFPASERSVPGLVISVCWAFGMWGLTGIAYFIRHWRHQLITMSIIPGVIALPMFWFLPESVVWLVAKERVKEAKTILKNAARMNGVQLPEKFRQTDTEEALLKEEANNSSAMQKFRKLFECPKREKAMAAEANYTIIDIFRSRKLTAFAFIMCYLWCVNGLVYYGLSLSTGSLSGDPYLNFFLSGTVEIPAYLIAAAALQFIGRRWPVCVFHVIAGVALLITLAIPAKTPGGTSLTPLIITLSMIGKFGITGSFGSIFLYTPELFPTTVRGVGMGIASVGGRVGNIVAPFSSYLYKVLPWFPNVLFGVMSVVGGILTLILPETLDRPFPQTIGEVERWTRTLTREEKERARHAKQLEREAKEMRKLGANQ